MLPVIRTSPLDQPEDDRPELIQLNEKRLAGRGLVDTPPLRLLTRERVWDCLDSVSRLWLRVCGLAASPFDTAVLGPQRLPSLSRLGLAQGSVANRKGWTHKLRVRHDEAWHQTDVEDDLLVLG